MSNQLDVVFVKAQSSAAAHQGLAAKFAAIETACAIRLK